jgi:hypothetical protein
LLAERIEEMEKGPESRRAMKAEVARKRKASKTKKAKRKYRNLDRGDSVTGTSEGVGDELCSEDELPQAGAHEDMIEGREVNNSDVHRHERAAENGPIR